MSHLTLLAVQCKKTDAVDLKGPIWKYIASTYSEQQANEAAEDLAEVQVERNEVASLTGSMASLQATLQKYYCGLSMMETRFPISSDREHVHMTFKWYDAFRPTRSCEQASIHFEKAAVLFNLGGVLTQQALSVDRNSDSGLKDAARKFQEAAGVFALLRDGPSLKVEQPRPIDISPECAAMLEKLCLAQAQEVTFEKARQDKKKRAILARLAKQAAAYYADVRAMLSNYPLVQHFDKSWFSHVSVKAVLYEAEAQSQSAAGLHEEQDVAPEISRIKEAQKLLAGIKKETKGVSRELSEAVSTLNEQLGSNLLRADRENATVYLQRIPAFIDLPPIAPAALVKPIPPVLDSARDGLFTSVIPDGSAKALSKYTELVDGLIREQMDALEGASDDARIKLREWELPECLQALEAGSAAALPDGLRAELEQLEEHGGVRHLIELQAQIKELRKVAEAELKAVEEELAREAREDADLRDKYGQRWTRPASAALNSQITEKIAGYKANLAAAGDSDARLEQRLHQNGSQLSSLSIDAAVSQLPRLQAPMVTTGDMEPAIIVTKLRQALSAINDLSNERAGLEEALKVEKNRDNILPRIMASSGNYDGLFKEELRKYDKLKADLAENVAKQAQLMGVISQNQAAYKHTFGYNEWRSACEAGASGMRGKLGLYRELRDNMSEGLRFYMSLQEAINTLRQQAGDYVLTRSMQRDDMLEDFRRGSEEEARRQREAAEKAARDRAAASLAQLSLQQQSQAPSQGAQGSWPPQSAPQNYPPVPSWQQQPSSQQPPAPSPQSASAYPPQAPSGGLYGAPPAAASQSGQPPSGGSYGAPPPTHGAPPPPSQPRHSQYGPPAPQSQGSGSYSAPPHHMPGGQQGGYSAPHSQSYGDPPPHQQPPPYGQPPSSQYPPPSQYYQHPSYNQAPQYNYSQPQQPPSYNSYGGQHGSQHASQPPSSQGSYYNPYNQNPPPQHSQEPQSGASNNTGGSTQNPLW